MPDDPGNFLRMFLVMYFPLHDFYFVPRQFVGLVVSCFSSWVINILDDDTVPELARALVLSVYATPL